MAQMDERFKKFLKMNDAELDAELEKVQQNITLTLQTVDQNFEKCNQIISGTIIPEIEKCTKASREIWDRSRSWLYFFQLHAHSANNDPNEPQFSTNRPPFLPYPVTNTATIENLQSTSTLSNPWERFHRDIQECRGTTFEHLSPGSDSTKGMLRKDSHRPLQVVDITSQHNTNNTRNGLPQIPSTGDISSTQSSSLYSRTTRLLDIDDDDTDSLNSSSKDQNMMDVDMMNQRDLQTSITDMPPRKLTTPHSNFSTSNNLNIGSGRRSIVDKGKSVDTSTHMRRYEEENPMLQKYSSANRSTLMDRLEKAQQGPLSTTDIDTTDRYERHHHHHHHYTKETPGPTHHSNTSKLNVPSSSNPLANTPTMERVLKNYNKDYRKLPKQSRLMEDMDFNARLAHASQSSSTSDTTRRKATGASSPFFAAPIQRDIEGMDQLHSSGKINNNSNNTPSQETQFWTTRTDQRTHSEMAQHHRSKYGEQTPMLSATPQQSSSSSNPLASARSPSPSSFAANHIDNNRGNDNDNDMDMAYEFSPLIPRQQPRAGDDNEAGHLTPHSQHSQVSNDTNFDTTSSSIMTMMSGMSAQLPARFDLHLFEETYQNPPASVQLTKIYNLFAERPGEMLEFHQVLDVMRENQPEEDDMLLHQDQLKVLLTVLTRKKFLRRKEKCWTLRR